MTAATISQPLETFRAAMTEAGFQIRESDNRAQCPGHDGDGFNLAFNTGSDGTLLLYCHSRECTAADICEGLAITEAELFPNGSPRKNVRTKANIDGKVQTVHTTSEAVIRTIAWGLSKDGRISQDQQPDHVWIYHNAHGDLVGNVLRWNVPGDKIIRQVRRYGDGWISRAMQEPRPLYRLPEVIDAETVYVCEGEKAADTIVSIGLQATTSSQDSQSSEKTDWSPLNHRHVVLLPDNDEPGRKYVGTVIGLLERQAPMAGVTVKHLWDDLPEMEPADDAHDWSEYYDSQEASTLRRKLEALPSRTTEYQRTEPAKAKQTDQPNSHAPIAWEFKSVWKAIENPLSMREAVIEGLVRRGEVMNIVASTKVGKSWMAARLSFSVVTGIKWLGRATRQGRVLLIDNELHCETIQNRLASVAGAMNIQHDRDDDAFSYCDVRGETVGIEDIQFQLSQFQPGELTLVVLDAKYRFFIGMDENSNSAQTEFHNAIDRLAKQLNCTIALVHAGVQKVPFHHVADAHSIVW